MAAEVLPRSALAQKLLSMADRKSFEEMSKELSGVISAREAATHLSELLKAPDWMSAAQEDRLITIRMSTILATLEDRFQDIDNMTLQLKILKELGNRLDKRQAATTVDLNTWSVNTGRELGRIVDLSLSYMRGALREQVDPEKWDELLTEAMSHARVEIAKSEITE
jgi:hypothetical protein